MAKPIWMHEDITLERTHNGMIGASTWVTDLDGTDRLTRVTCDTMAGAAEVVQTWLILMQYDESYMQEVLTSIPDHGESWALGVDNAGAYVIDLSDLDPVEYED